MVKNYSNTDNIKKLKDSNITARQYHSVTENNSSVNFSSLDQGKKYNNNKDKIKSLNKQEGFTNNVNKEDYLTAPLFRKAYRNAFEPNNSQYAPNNSLIEGFTDEQYNSVQKIEDISNNLNENDKQLQNLYKQFNSKIDEYSAEKSRITNLTQDYLLRTGSSHIYHGKNVQTDDGIKGYVTDKGVFKKYSDDATYQSITGKGRCPKDNELVTMEGTLDNLSNSMSPMIQGSNMNSNSSKARYVRIEGKNQYLHIQELEVYSGDTNIAKVVTEIQEKTANENETFNCTGNVFYGKKYANGNSGDIASYDQLSESTYKTKENTGDIDCNNTTFGSDPLSGKAKQCICKVQTGGASVTASSKGWNGEPGYIIDGNKEDTQPWPNSVHTQNGKNEWIEVDLKDEFSISRITLYNRPDCCQDVLNGAVMKLLDANKKQIYPTISLTGERLQEFMIRTLPRGQTCGSEGKNVYVNQFPNVKDNQPTYLGCFNDNSDRRMEWDGSAYMSFDDCKNKALDSKSTFFALQDTKSDGTSACMLSNNIIKSTSDGKAVSKDFTWAANVSSSTQNTYYLFLDYDGNLMIKDSENKDTIIWQTNTGNTETDDNTYIKYKNTDFPGNDIEGKSMKRSDCETHCNDLNDCVGYNSSKNSNFCWFKKSKGNQKTTNSWNFFMKGRKTFLVMRNNGDLVLYTGHPRDGTKTKNRKVLWSSNTISNDGLVIEEWKPDKNGGNKYKTNYILPGQSLESNKLISSNNGKRVAIMQSDGNFVIYKGSSKCVDKQDYIGGASWTNSIYMLNNTKYKSETGKYVGGEPVSDTTPKYERVQLGDCLSYCENSNECNSFSFGKENKKDKFDTCLLYRNVPESRDDNKKMKSYQQNIKNPFEIGWKNAGKIGYVDENAVLHEMSDKYKTWENEYTEYPNTNSKYNDIKTGIIGDTNTVSAIDQVKEMCNNDPNCAGFVYNPTDRKYWLKNENIYPIGNKTSNVNDMNLYVRKRAVKSNKGCSTDVNGITSMEWENYEKGNMYNDSIKCGLSTTLDNSRLYELENELSNILKQISEKMKNVNETTETNSIESHKQMLMMKQRFTELENVKKQIETIEPREEKEDILDKTLNSKDQHILPSLFNYWFKNTTNVLSSQEGTGQTEGVQTSSGSASEEVGCENQASCMDDLTSYNQSVAKESFTTLTTPFDNHKEDLSILALGTLGIIGTMIAFNTCSKCK